MGHSHTHTHILGILIISDRAQKDMCGLVVQGFCVRASKLSGSRNSDRTSWRYDSPFSEENYFTTSTSDKRTSLSILSFDILLIYVVHMPVRTLTCSDFGPVVEFLGIFKVALLMFNYKKCTEACSIIYHYIILESCSMPFLPLIDLLHDI